jgi:Lrp/AsnC family leucine-responsive transcriptional regulator
MIDEIDLQIIGILQDNGRIPAAEVARRVGMAPSAVFERIRKLEDRGVVRSYSANIDPSAVGMSLLAFVFVNVQEEVGSDEPGHQLASIPGVQEVHHVAGEDSYLVKVRAKDPEALGRLLREQFGKIKQLRSTRTTIVLETLKHSSSLPFVVPGNHGPGGNHTLPPADGKR